VNREEARAAIIKGIDDHEEARITRAALVTIIEHTTDKLWEKAVDDGYAAGLAEGDDADDETLFEADIDFDGFTDDDVS
jgi:hypothetical protein